MATGYRLPAFAGGIRPLNKLRAELRPKTSTTPCRVSSRHFVLEHLSAPLRSQIKERMDKAASPHSISSDTARARLRSSRAPEGIAGDRSVSQISSPVYECMNNTQIAIGAAQHSAWIRADQREAAAFYP